MRDGIDLITLRVIVAAADAGSISAASGHLDLAVAAASARVSSLPLQTIRLKDSWATRVHSIATRSDVPVSPAARPFIETLRSVQPG